MNNRGTIYSIICKVNGKRYIGQTKQDLGKRWRQHIQESKRHSDRPLYRAIQKYGVGMFQIRAIEEDILDNVLNERECYWIEQFDTYNSGYNATTGGEVSKTIHPEVRDKISSSMKGKVRSDSHIANIIASKRRTHHFKVKGNGKHHRTKVRGTNVNSGEVVEFNSLTEACEKLGIKSGNLSRAIKEGWAAGGYKWEKLENKTHNQPIYGKRILDGKIIHHFNSVREAGRVLGSGSDSGVRKALKNPSRYSWKGCRWYCQE